jgi:16S rRNA (cytidine1402-2'-O)-methyltransferase
VPIGNLGDITLRAIETLGAADLILAEDTRSAQRLLSHLGLGRPLERYDDHIAEKMRPRVLAALEEGRRVALISEAGTPLLSDPGFKLVRDVLAAGHAVYPVPGPSALLAALVKSGMPTDRFLFAGFPPPRSAQRRRAFDEIASLEATLVYYESPRRLAGCLADMAAVLGAGRRVAVLRELTKLFEERVAGTLGELAEHYAISGAPKGEVVIVVGPPEEGQASAAQTDASAGLDAALTAALGRARLKQAVAEVAAETGLKRTIVYARALQLKGDGG